MQALQKTVPTKGLQPRRALRVAKPSRVRVCPVSCNAAQPQNIWYDEHRKLPSYRSVYDFNFWVAHRNPLRYFTRSFDMHQSQVLRNILPSVLWVGAVAVTTGLYGQALAANVLPEVFPTIATVSRFAQAFVTNTAVAMSLLLVFRTNQSYSRWDEARKFWGATLNRSRDIVRQALTIFPDTCDSAKQALVRWHISFVRAMHRHFQNEGNLQDDLKDILPENELQMLLNSQHRPMKALHVMGEIIMQVPMSPIHQAQMSANISHFHDQLGACERLLRTPIPISYTRHTSRFLFIWLTMLPIALFPTVGWATVPLAMLIAISLLKIDEIGVQIEEPFSILPLDVIAGRIQTDALSQLKDDQQVKALVKEGTMLAPTYANGAAKQMALA